MKETNRIYRNKIAGREKDVQAFVRLCVCTVRLCVCAGSRRQDDINGVVVVVRASLVVILNEATTSKLELRERGP